MCNQSVYESVLCACMQPMNRRDSGCKARIRVVPGRPHRIVKNGTISAIQASLRVANEMENREGSRMPNSAVLPQDNDALLPVALPVLRNRARCNVTGRQHQCRGVVVVGGEDTQYRVPWP